MIECVAAHGCITCGDEAIPMRVIGVDPARILALCSGPDGERCSVEIALVEPVVPGEVLLVHAGTALARAVEGVGCVHPGTALARAAEGAGSMVLDAAEREEVPI
ncbi:MAG TPA: HypC/HybG/HupF family hydrogenase formation chaperone [Solirubrobacteraceae bacterium]|jgi:hypothetical protein|nr:HypC/HybG/HupF family hydrogenase formation chaperone [Solirubrobacteraceae bacterium]